MFESLEARQLFSFSNWGAADQLIQLPDALQAYQNKGITLNGTGQTIAIIDSGINYNLPALGGGIGPTFKVIAGYNFVDSNTDVLDAEGHGTNVAGTIAADPFTDGGITYQGVAPGAKLIALKVDDDGLTAVPDSRIEQALQWVIDNRVQYGITIVNISYGEGLYPHHVVSSIYGDEIQELHDEGVTLVASSGNSPGTDQPNAVLGITTPAADPNVISVGSVDASDIISDFSDRGSVLDMLAPGEDVETTFRDGGYGMVAGTSFASPIVAGTVALMRQVDPTLTPADTLSILRASGVENFDGDHETGAVTRLIYPRLDILNAVNMTSARIAAPTSDPALLGRYGNGNNIAIDAEGVTHLVYYDSSAQTMMYATRSVGGNWSALQTIDDSMPFQGYYLSLALSPEGQPTVAYFDGVNGDLKYAAYDGTSWTIENVDTKNSVGLYPSMVYDRNGLPLIAYYRKTTGDLRVAKRGFGVNGAWTFNAIDSQDDVGRSTAAAIDADGRVGIAYENSSYGSLKYALMNPRTGIFSKTTLDTSTHGVSFISTTFNTDDNNPWISYYDANPADLKVASFKNNRWTIQRLVSKGATGLYSNIFFAEDNQPGILYYDRRVDSLYLASMNGNVWTYTLLQTNAGRDASAAVDPLDGLFRYTYYDSTSGYIRVGVQVA